MSRVSLLNFTPPHRSNPYPRIHQLFYVTAHTSLHGIIIHFLCKLPANILTDEVSSVDVLLQPSFLFYPEAFFLHVAQCGCMLTRDQLQHDACLKFSF